MSHRFEQGEQGEQGPAPTSSSSEGRATIGWVQSTTSGEIDTALACAKRHAEVLLLNDIDAAADALRQRPLRAVVLAQPRRGVWTSDDCERLRQISPLAQLIGVHGSWCEGWHRTGHVWSGVEHL